MVEIDWEDWEDEDLTEEEKAEIIDMMKKRKEKSTEESESFFLLDPHPIKIKKKRPPRLGSAYNPRMPSYRRRKKKC